MADLAGSRSSLYWYTPALEYRLDPLPYSTAVPVPGDPEVLYAGDIDNDGFEDVVYVADRSNSVGWLRSDGNGSLVHALTLTSSLTGARRLAVFDVDDDGDLDVLGVGNGVGTASWGANVKGSGVFAVPADGRGVLPLADEGVGAASYGLMAVAAADFDGDGIPDVAITSHDPAALRWWRNDGSGNFSAPPEGRGAVTSPGAHVDGESLAEVVVGDVDLDGTADLVLCERFRGTVSWFSNDGTGRFGPPRFVASDIYGAFDVFLADLDDDGDLDALVTGYDSGLVEWRENKDGRGSFARPASGGTLHTGPKGPQAASASDVNGDGVLDVVVSVLAAQDAVQVFLGLGGGRFAAPASLQTGISSSAVFIDMDSDGVPDAVVNENENTVSWYRGGGAAVAKPLRYRVAQPTNGGDDEACGRAAPGGGAAGATVTPCSTLNGVMRGVSGPPPLGTPAAALPPGVVVEIAAGEHAVDAPWSLPDYRPFGGRVSLVVDAAGATLRCRGSSTTVAACLSLGAGTPAASSRRGRLTLWGGPLTVVGGRGGGCLRLSGVQGVLRPWVPACENPFFCAPARAWLHPRAARGPAPAPTYGPHLVARNCSTSGSGGCASVLGAPLGLALPPVDLSDCSAPAGSGGALLVQGAVLRLDTARGGHLALSDSTAGGSGGALAVSGELSGLVAGRTGAVRVRRCSSAGSLAGSLASAVYVDALGALAPRPAELALDGDVNASVAVRQSRVVVRGAASVLAESLAEVRVAGGAARISCRTLGHVLDDATGAVLCSACVPGTAGKAIAEGRCHPCAPGRSAPAFGALKCEACAPGRVATLEGSALCQVCPVGRAANASRAASGLGCAVCAAGRVAAVPGSTACAACRPGHESETPGSSSCVPCASGRAGPGGSPCRDCEPGRFSKGVASAECAPCAVGWSISVVGSPFCTHCPAGRYSAEPGATACDACGLRPPLRDANGTEMCGSVFAGADLMPGSVRPDGFSVSVRGADAGVTVRCVAAPVPPGSGNRVPAVLEERALFWSATAGAVDTVAAVADGGHTVLRVGGLGRGLRYAAACAASPGSASGTAADPLRLSSALQRTSSRFVTTAAFVDGECALEAAAGPSLRVSLPATGGAGLVVRCVAAASADADALHDADRFWAVSAADAPGTVLVGDGPGGVLAGAQKGRRYWARCASAAASAAPALRAGVSSPLARTSPASVVVRESPLRVLPALAALAAAGVAACVFAATAGGPILLARTDRRKWTRYASLWWQFGVLCAAAAYASWLHLPDGSGGPPPADRLAWPVTAVLLSFAALPVVLNLAVSLAALRAHAAALRSAGRAGVDGTTLNPRPQGSRRSGGAAPELAAGHGARTGGSSPAGRRGRGFAAPRAAGLLRRASSMAERMPSTPASVLRGCGAWTPVVLLMAALEPDALLNLNTVRYNHTMSGRRVSKAAASVLEAWVHRRTVAAQTASAAGLVAVVATAWYQLLYLPVAGSLLLCASAGFFVVAVLRARLRPRYAGEVRMPGADAEVETKKFLVFVGHQGVDKVHAEVLHFVLEAVGVPSFLDKYSLPRGLPFPVQIAEVIRHCVVAVELVSENFIRPDRLWPMMELNTLEQLRKPIIPVFLGDRTGSGVPQNGMAMRVRRLVRERVYDAESGGMSIRVCLDVSGQPEADAVGVRVLEVAPMGGSVGSDDMSVKDEDDEYEGLKRVPKYPLDRATCRRVVEQVLPEVVERVKSELARQGREEELAAIEKQRTLERVEELLRSKLGMEVADPKMVVPPPAASWRATSSCASAFACLRRRRDPRRGEDPPRSSSVLGNMYCELPDDGGASVELGDSSHAYFHLSGDCEQASF